MSDGGRERASLGVEVWTSFQKWSVRLSAVRSIAWLDLRRRLINRYRNEYITGLFWLVESGKLLNRQTSSTQLLYGVRVNGELESANLEPRIIDVLAGWTVA